MSDYTFRHPDIVYDLEYHVPAETVKELEKLKDDYEGLKGNSNDYSEGYVIVSPNKSHGTI